MSYLTKSLLTGTIFIIAVQSVPTCTGAYECPQPVVTHLLTVGQTVSTLIHVYIGGRREGKKEGVRDQGKILSIYSLQLIVSRRQVNLETFINSTC